MKVVILIAIAVLVALSSFISSLGKLYDKRYSSWRRIRRRGWWVIILNLGIIVLSIIQWRISENEENAAKTKAEKESRALESRIRADYSKSVEAILSTYDNKTKEIKAAYDSSADKLKNNYDTSTTNIVKALAEYGLTYNKRTDSIENLIKTSRSPEPDFNFCNTAFTLIDSINDPIVIEFSFCNRKAASSNINIVCYILYQLNDNSYVYGQQKDPIPKNLALAADIRWAIPLNFSNQLLTRAKSMLVLLKGSYANKDGSKSYLINEIAAYDFTTKKSGFPPPHIDEKAREIFRANGIN